MFKTVSAIALLAVVLAGCGGGGSSSPPGTTSATTTTAPSSPSASGDATLGTAQIPGLGTVVTDAKGYTVYVLTSAATKNLPCTDANGCTKVWPPIGTSTATAGSGLDASLLGTTKVGGKTYPTYNGYLMYGYIRDGGPAGANGFLLKSFGGTWYVLSASGNPVKNWSSTG